VLPLTTTGKKMVSASIQGKGTVHKLCLDGIGDSYPFLSKYSVKKLFVHEISDNCWQHVSQHSFSERIGDMKAMSALKQNLISSSQNIEEKGFSSGKFETNVGCMCHNERSKILKNYSLHRRTTAFPATAVLPPARGEDNATQGSAHSGD
jgi:hypothetical protein